MSRTFARRLLQAFSFSCSSFILLFIVIVFLVIFLPGLLILNIQGSHCRNTLFTWNKKNLMLLGVKSILRKYWHKVWGEFRMMLFTLSRNRPHFVKYKRKQKKENNFRTEIDNWEFIPATIHNIKGKNGKYPHPHRHDMSLCCSVVIVQNHHREHHTTCYHHHDAVEVGTCKTNYEMSRTYWELSNQREIITSILERQVLSSFSSLYFVKRILIIVFLKEKVANTHAGQPIQNNV